MTVPLLSVCIFLPLAGVLLVGVIPRDSEKTIKLVTLASMVAALAASIAVLFSFDSQEGGFQLVEKFDWVRSAGAQYHLGVDGISLWLVILTTFLFPLCVLGSWNTIERKVKAFHTVLLLLETGILGVFLALDLMLFYVFWEGMLIPMYFVIGVWGYSRRVYAAVKFFLYTLAGSLFMLAAIAGLYFIGGRTFDITELASSELGINAQRWLFAAFFVSFAIKVPIFPLHTWLPDAHTEAPTAGSVILAGVLLKMGAYGFLRFSLPIFPEAAREFAPWLALLGVIGIVYGGLVSLVQKDIKRLVAYSSVSHLGFVVLGISAMNTTATSGSVLQMVNHGLSTGVLFLMVGIIYSRGHTREINELRGLNRSMPLLGGMFLLAALSSLGLPGLNGFVGEFLILNGAFDVFRGLVVIATTGVILAAIYLLWTFERVFTGAAPPGAARTWRDISPIEAAAVIPMLVAILFIGVYPKPLLDRIEPTVRQMVSDVKKVPAQVAGR